MNFEIYNSNNEKCIIKSNGPFLLQAVVNPQTITIFENSEISSTQIIGETQYIGEISLEGENR